MQLLAKFCKLQFVNIWRWLEVWPSDVNKSKFTERLVIKIINNFKQFQLLGFGAIQKDKQ